MEDLYTSLMTNKDFRDWVLDPTKQRNLYWQKWMEVSSEHRRAAYEARDSILKFRFKEEHLEEGRLEEILSDIISEDSPDARQETNGYAKWLLAAAVVLIAMTTAFVVYYPVISNLGATSGEITMKKVFNPPGQKSRIKLPDGSVVSLNAGSSLSFPERFDDNLREVELSGEAFFDVVHDKKRPFVVKAGHLDTEVMGTSFNVKSYEEENTVSVALVSGKVVVSGDNIEADQGYILQPGEKISYDKGSLTYEKSEFDSNEETGWTNGKLVFKDTNFSKFITRLERWYGVEIDIINSPSREWNVNGHFENESLQEVLTDVQYTYNIDFDIKGKEIKLYCK